MSLTSIEWARYSFNLAWGCIRATAGCENCYAERLARRWGYDVWGVGAERRTFGEAYWREPVKWNAIAAAANVRERVFCSSMTDVFLNDPTIDAERKKLWPLIEATPALDWLLLTKHPERFKTTLPARLPANARLGVSVEDNSAAWRVDIVRDYPNFLSVEPMLGPIDRVDLTRIEWVIVGGESGPGARPMDPAWARDVRDRCVAAGIPFFFKQLGGVRDKLGGEDALLDGRRWTEFPRTIARGTAA